jgi:hypothetical protein
MTIKHPIDTDRSQRPDRQATPPDSAQDTSQRTVAIGALIAAATFVFGIALFLAVIGRGAFGGPVGSDHPPMGLSRA